MCRWLEEAGADAIHVSAGTTFPHPLNPAGDLPLAEVHENYDGLISSGSARLPQLPPLPPAVDQPAHAAAMVSGRATRSRA